MLKINEKRYDEAEQLLRRAIAAAPRYPAPHYNLRRVYMETGRYEDADRELWTAIDKGLRDPLRSIDRAAQEYDQLAKMDRAVALLEEAIRRYPDHEPYRVHLLVDRIRTDDCRQAVTEGAEAARRFPTSAPVQAFYGIAAACAGDVDTARQAMQRSLELKPDQPTLRQSLAALEPSS